MSYAQKLSAVDWCFLKATEAWSKDIQMRGSRKGEKEENGKNPVCKANTVVQNLALSVGVGP